MIEENTSVLISQIIEVIAGNKLIWIPVLAAWAFSFLFTKYLNSKHLKRKADREWRVYRLNFLSALSLYILFHYGHGMKAIEQGMLAGAVAVIVPAVWFWWQKKKTANQ